MADQVAPHVNAQAPFAYAVTATAAAVIAVVLYYLLYLGPLGSIPGPIIARVSPLWLVYHSRKGDMHRATIELHQKYGPLVRTGPNEVSVSDLSAIKRIYSAGGKFWKADWYSIWQGTRKFDLFPERNEKLHGTQKRLVSRLYSMDALKEGEKYVDSAISVYLSKLQDKAGKPFDMAYWNQLFAFDVIGEVTFSKRFGYLQNGDDNGTFSMINRILRSAAVLGQALWLYKLDTLLAPYIGSHAGIRVRHGGLRQFAVDEIDARMSRGSDRTDFLGKFMSVHEAKPVDFNADAVLSMTTSNVNAGSDTTAISLSSVFYCLCKNPEAQRKLREEVDDRYKRGLIGASIPTDVALKMPYLQACIQEALRLHPAVGFTLPRIVPAEGLQIGDRYLPAGTVIGTNAWVVHRNKAVYGEDAEEFRPERWLEGDTTDMERYNLTFGAGSRICLGKHLSWMEMSKLVPLVVLQFNLALADPKARLEEECHWFCKIKGMYVVLTERQEY